MMSAPCSHLRRWFGVLLPLAGLAACDGTVPTSMAHTLVATAADVGVLSNPVRISQVYGGGGNSGATLTHDFIELYNAGSAAVSLVGWSVQYASTLGTTWQRTNLAGSIPGGGYYLVQQAQGAGGTTPLPTPDATGTIAMSATAGKVALVGNITTLSGACPAGLVDLLGYGSGTDCSEAIPTANLSNTTAALRNGNGSVDTDNNGADFTIAAPNPRNSTVSNSWVTSTVPANGATGVAVDADLSVTFNRAVNVGASWYTISCSLSGAHSATATGGPATFTINPDADFLAGETCTATIHGSEVTDQANGALSMPADFSWSFATAAANACTLPFTAAYTIQGSGAATPLDGQTVTTQGVVVGDYEGASPTQRGFFLQDLTGDGDAATSDGIFVFNGNNDNVALGDVVRVTGVAAEFQGQTQIGNVTSIAACGTGSVSPVDVTLPVASATMLEQYEGMLVRLPQTLTVTENFLLGRFGLVEMSSGARLVQPTQVALPGAAALALQAQNDLNRIIVDDARNDQNADPILFGRGGLPLSASNTLRIGDAATGIVGVMTYTWAGNAASGNAYRVRPVNALGGGIPDFTPANPRPPLPAATGGTLRVAAMNLLNYYNTFTGCTDGVGGAPSQCRGATNTFEFDRQWPKTIAAAAAMNVDVLGIIEVENDGYGATSAIADFVNRLNTATAPGTYAFIDVDAATGQLNALGIDAIKVGLVYKPASVTPVGNTAVLNAVAFVNGGDATARNRPALAQAFQQPGGERLVVSVNHLKSKGSPCDAPDAGDGQGNCAQVRTNAAQQLATWLATDPTGMLDPDVLILGDLNAYAMEDPITAIRNAGFTDLVAQSLGTDAYSYVFGGQSGYLDHALGSASLASQVAGVTEWHINADEPSVLDYNTEFKTAGHVASLYGPDAYRMADHDPVIVGLNLVPTKLLDFGGFQDPVAPAPAVNRVKAGSAVPVKFSLDGDQGLEILAPGYPQSRAIACATGGVAANVVDETMTAGQSGLSYDAASDTYTYVWKTSKAWTGTCRELVVKLADASVHTATFQFVR